MPDNLYVLLPDLRQQAELANDRFSSQTLHNDANARLILFGFAAGQSLPAHKAPCPVMLTFLKGEAVVTLGAEQQQAAEGTLIYIAPHVEHELRAMSDTVMLLTMFKNQVPSPEPL